MMLWGQNTQTKLYTFVSHLHACMHARTHTHTHIHTQTHTHPHTHTHMPLSVLRICSINNAAPVFEEVYCLKGSPLAVTKVG